MAELPCTPGQTVGPFLGLGLPYSGDSDLVADGYPGAVRLHGTVYDGAGAPVPDALVELWQRDGDGRIAQRPGSLRRDGTFTGWGRCATDAGGRYSFVTVAPGGRPPFFALAVFARGLLHRLFTRAYLPHDEVRADPALGALVCVPESDCAAYRFDIHLQGPHETVFLEYRR
ncbi:protocatechuate 3,4-dioxygenase subunit alpha [Mycobacterium paraense]|uniref:protocatechuate 3,4-dioxygenase subunit alpha n=1 Tax=Mycobacterium paraense TaxID=767916 RepID=UPI000A14A409|nr:protocatechuate 3,4-dioxygenase subunit alpha [Mycobacterium paraense]MCV7442108.1 protocatechuate 3,4-dioxygenase subunit alpha [Mycobacterium paraense]ORW41109.1 protocatechuate 3,4-dioxygenase subunit alpha [Mycobacterium paraense]